MGRKGGKAKKASSSVENVDPVDGKLDRTAQMVFYEDRLKSFQKWPFTAGSCTAEKMAEAGFYHTPASSSPDGVRCFVCWKELDGWQPEDDPWQEHASHTTNCQFVLVGKSEKDLTVDDMISFVMQAAKAQAKVNADLGEDSLVKEGESMMAAALQPS